MIFTTAKRSRELRAGTGANVGQRKIISPSRGPTESRPPGENFQHCLHRCWESAAPRSRENKRIVRRTQSPSALTRGLGRFPRIAAALSFVLFLSLPAGAASSDASTLQRSVVKIYVTQQRWDYTIPWQRGPAMNATGSGFVLPGKRILTNAHVVSDARFLQVRNLTDPRMFSAKVEFIAHDCDLASLRVEDDAFFGSTEPARFASDLPTINDEVIVLGYPLGGTRLSVTRGVVSRLDYSVYTHSGVDQHLVLQVDAAINPGNSGGPVMFKGKVVGLAFQGLAGGENIGYAIPMPVIQRFLQDIQDGKYNGFPELGANHLDTRNPALRRSLGLPEPMRGVVVSYLDPYGAAQGKLRLRDVLLSVDGHVIGEDGTIEVEGNNVPFPELLERKQWGEDVTFRVWRNRNDISVKVPLRNPTDPFTYRNLYDQRPAYLIKGGLVFVPLTRELLHAHERNQADPAVQQLFYYSEYAKIDALCAGRQEFVVLLRRLPHPVNTYADPFINGIVSEANGFPIGDLASLKAALAKDQEGYHVLRFAGLKNLLVLDAKTVREADPLILDAYDVPAADYLESEK
jgi:S1-C subfamily serine protease